MHRKSRKIGANKTTILKSWAVRLGLLVIFFLSQNATTNIAYCQEVAEMVIDTVTGDTFYVYNLSPIVIAEKRTSNFKEYWRWLRLKYDVMKVYPYAIAAAALYREIEDSLAKLKTKRQRKRYLKSLEKRLREEFEEPLKGLTIRQGKILVKLIQRETGKTLYEILKEYKSGFSAIYWQSLGSFLGYDLKTVYDPELDKDLDFILRSLDETYKGWRLKEDTSILNELKKQIQDADQQQNKLDNSKVKKKKTGSKQKADNTNNGLQPARQTDDDEKINDKNDNKR